MADQKDKDRHLLKETGETKAWYKDFVDHATELVQSVDSEGRFIYVNQVWLSTLKYKAEEVDHITLFDIIHPDSMEHCKAIYKQVLAGKAHGKVEAVFVAKDGTPVLVEGSVNYKLDESGRFVHTRGIFRNITERKRADNVSRLLFDISNAVSTVQSLDDLYQSIHTALGRVMDVTNFFIAIVDMENRTLYFPYHVDSEDDDFLPIMDFNPVGSLTGLVVSKRQPVLLKKAELDERAQKGGVPGPLSKIWMGTPLMIEDQVIGIVAVQSYTDPDLYSEDDLRILSAVSDQMASAIARKRAEEALKASEEQYRTLYQNIPIGVYRNTPGPEGRFLMANPGFMQIFGIKSKEELETLKVADLYQEPAERASFSERLINDGYLKGFEGRLKRLDGTPIWGSITAQTIYREDGKAAWFDCTIEDITERKQAEEALRLSEERAKKQRAAIAELVLAESIVKGETAVALNKICAVTAKAFDVERSSIWILDENDDELKCLSLYEASSGKLSSGAVLQAKIIPRYFAALKEESRIYAENAREDPRTSELKEDYLKPLGITSMLDAGIIIDGEIKGVFCLEHVGNPRLWQADEEAFASTVASIVAQLFITAERKNLFETLKQSEAKYRFLTENITDVVWTIDLSGKLTYMSPSISRLTGFTAAELMNLPMHEYFVQEDLDSMLAKIADEIAKPPGERASSTFMEARHKTKDHRLVPVELHGSWIEDEKGNIIGVQGSTRNITERKLAEEALKESEHKHREILAAMNEGYYEVDLAGNLVFFNESFRRLTGLSSDELMGKSYKQFYYDPKEVFKTFNQVYQTGNSVTAADWLAVNKDGREAYMELSVSLRHDEKGNPIGFRGIVRDITERRQTDEKIRYLSYHDQLTGLHNRHFLEEEMKRLDTERQLPISIIMADLNGLKLVNDTYGHQTGDEMLKKVAEVLKTACRDDDLISRFGGDEFVLYLPQTPEAEAQKISERIERSCRKEKVSNVPLSLSTGVAVKVNVEQKLTSLLKAAEDSLYQNKLTESRSGKSAIVNTLLQTLAAKSFETETHTRNMQEAAHRIGEQLGLPDSELRRLNLLITLHDIGKINIPEELLNKKEALTDAEWEIMKKHSEIGFRIARATEEFAHVAADILAHHERWDGSGYPQGLKGVAIPLLARITALADAYEVMSYGRPYKKAMAPKAIVTELKSCSGTQFDPELVEIFLSVLKAFTDEEVS